MTYRHIAVAVFAVALALALVASGGFGAAELDRNAAIQVVDDERAAIGVQACSLPAEASGAANRSAERDSANGTEDDDRATPVTPIGVEITNRIGSELTVSELAVDGGIVDQRPYAMTIPPGDSERITIPARSDPDEVTAIMSANGVSTRITVSDVSDDGCPFQMTVPSVEGDERGSDGTETAHNGES